MQIKNKKLRDFLASVLSGVLSGINRLLPKDPKKVLFYTNTGVKDNLKAVLDFMAASPSYASYTLICSCDDPAGIRAGNRVKRTGNLSGLFIYLTSGFVFYYNGKIPVKPSKKQTVVNLWHGIPLKKIGRMLYPTLTLNFATYYLAPSPFSGELMKAAFGCSDAQLLYNGLPRCDLLFEAPSAKKACAILGRSDCQRLIGWMPTFRRAEVSDIRDSDLGEHSTTGLPLLHDAADLETCNALLKEAKTLLWIKLHPSESGISQTARYSNILIQSDMEFQSANVELYRLLGSCEALITDYSSVYFDYLLLDRPIGFAVEDIASYSENRGFTVSSPLSVMPGPILTDRDDFFRFLQRFLSGAGDDYSQKRAQVRARFCGEVDRCAVLSLLKKINLKGADIP